MTKVSTEAQGIVDYYGPYAVTIMCGPTGISIYVWMFSTNMKMQVRITGKIICTDKVSLKKEGVSQKKNLCPHPQL